jgi:type II secretory pathway component PulF
MRALSVRQKWISFYWHMHFCLTAGMTVDAALSAFMNQSSKTFKKIIKRIYNGYQQGALLSQLFDTPYIPDKSFTVMILKSSEKTGQYAQAFYDLAEYQTWRLRLLSRIIQVFQYPFFLLFLAGLMLGFALFILIPELSPVLEELSETQSSHLNELHRLVLYLEEQWVSILLSAVVPIVFFLILYFAFSKVRLRMQQFFFHLPLFGNLARFAEMATFSKQTSTLLAQGITITIILDLQQRSASNMYLRKLYQTMKNQVIQGLDLSESLKKHRIFSGLLIQMVYAGEKSGALGATLQTAARFFTEKFHQRVEVLMRVLPTSILIFVGGIFVFIMIQVILPLYDVISEVGF